MSFMYHQAFQPDRGMRGRGIFSSILAAAKPFVKPLAKRAFSAAKKTALRQTKRAALGLAKDVLLGRNPKKTIPNRAKNILKNTALSSINSLGFVQKQRRKNKKIRKKTKKKKTVSMKGRGKKKRTGPRKTRKKSQKGRKLPGMKQNQFNNLYNSWKKMRNVKKK